VPIRGPPGVFGLQTADRQEHVAALQTSPGRPRPARNPRREPHRRPLPQALRLHNEEGGAI
jgi:hypothetical protein